MEGVTPVGVVHNDSDALKIGTARPDTSATRPATLPPSFRDDVYVSEEMQNLLNLDCPEEAIVGAPNPVHYSNAVLFPDWLREKDEWKKTKVHADSGNAISEIVQIPHAQRSHDQVK